MRFSRHHRIRNSSDAAVLPLTNIVFLLLIFFMLAGRLAAPQAFDINPPHSVSDAAQHRGLEVELTANGKLALEGQPIPLKKLGTRVHTRLQDDPNLALRLKADGREDAAQVVTVMHILHDAGAHKLRLITVRQDE